MKRQFYIGADIGGTHMRTALVDQRGSIIKYQKALTDISRGAEQTSRRLTEQCRTLMAKSEELSGTVRSIGLGVAGKIDPQQGRVIFSPNLPEMRNYPIAIELQEQTQVPVFMENDANTFGLGEQWLGAGREIGNWIGVTLGTGVGGCLVLGGKLWNGDHLGFSGEIGHMIIDSKGPVCACGMNGCLEAHASGRALVKGAYENLAASLLENSRFPQPSHIDNLEPEDVYKEALRGNPAALKLFERMGWALGLAIGNLFTFLGIRCAIIGGGVSESWDLFIEPLRRSLADHCCMLEESSMIVKKSQLGDKAALFGAAWLARNEMIQR